ncbi:hypothetical protein LCGC14_0927240 [marine sediment metagenome]|uniref:Piwi domain-containing protein n=1 Tax=marine sediment metagenome TaxID=412755 RepID=A0A0F9P9V3_9ZZZZ
MIVSHCDIEVNIKKAPKMSIEEKIKQLGKKFPQLPKPSLWEKYDKKRYYFNKKVGGQDNTFFIDFTEINNPQLLLKQNTVWYSTYPDRIEIQNFLRQQTSSKKKLIPKASSEFYQVDTVKLGKIYCYKIEITGGKIQKIGGKLAYRLRSQFGGHWKFTEFTILSNNFIDDEKLNSFLEQLWSDENETFSNLTKIYYIKNKSLPPKALADFSASFLSHKFRRGIFKILEKYDKQEKELKIRKELNIRGWNINNDPAISLSVNSNIYYENTIDIFKAQLKTKDDLIGFEVIDIGLTHKGKITGFSGILKDHRNRLLKITSKEIIKQRIIDAPDNELVLSIDNKYDYVASSLHPIVTTGNAHYFKINTVNLMKNLTLSPIQRTRIEKEVISLFKQFISMNYNSETKPELFKLGEDIGFHEMLKFKDGTTHSSDEFVIRNIKNHGIYQLSQRFEGNKSLQIVFIIAALYERWSEFYDNLRAQLSSLGFLPQLTSVIKIEDFDRLSIEKKLTSIQKDKYDIIVAILPESQNKDRIYEIFKSSLFNLEIMESQFIFENTIVSKLKYALANVTLGILAKTGNIPYILANPLKFADYFVGIDISREKKSSLKGSQNFLAMARFYGRDGTFANYEIHEDKIEGETVPKIILEKIFAKQEFQNKIIMIHRDGYFRGSEVKDLQEIGEKSNIQFQFVEVIKRNSPRLFGGSNNEYTNPVRNQIFYLSEREAIIINNKITGNKTSKPIRVRTFGENVKLNDAILSVMSLRMMHFGTTKTPKLPVTISFSDRISGFARRGIKPPNKSGRIPWWY